MDRLNDLPDEILCHIGLFLSAKEAAFTTVLSKRWQNLITIVQDLSFDDSIKSFKDFADRLSSLPVTSRVRKLSLKLLSLESVVINNCLCEVLKRGVFDLNLSINGKEGHSISFWKERHADYLYPMVHGFINVEILNLNSYETLMMFYEFREELPVFEKLSHLSVNLSRRCWFPIKVLVQKLSPNLKTLTINGRLHYNNFISLCHCLSEFSFLVPCPVEVLKITEYYGNPEELRQMECILRKLSCLELVQVHLPKAKGEKKAKIESDLQKLSSSECKFQVVV